MLLRWTGLPDVRVIPDADRLPENAELAEGMRKRAAADIGSYLGEVIVRNSISCWVYDMEAQAAAVETMWRRRFFPHSRVGKRLAHGHPSDDFDALLAEASTYSLRVFYETAITGRLPPDAKITSRDFPL